MYNISLLRLFQVKCKVGMSITLGSSQNEIMGRDTASDELYIIVPRISHFSNFHWVSLLHTYSVYTQLVEAEERRLEPAGQRASSPGLLPAGTSHPTVLQACPSRAPRPGKSRPACLSLPTMPLSSHLGRQLHLLFLFPFYLLVLAVTQSWRTCSPPPSAGWSGQSPRLPGLPSNSSQVVSVYPLQVPSYQQRGN